MFIVAKKNFKIKRADGSLYVIKKDFVGEIPEDVARHWLVRAAIKSGSLAASESGKDKAMDAAMDAANANAEASDLRTDSKDKNKK